MPISADHRHSKIKGHGSVMSGQDFSAFKAVQKESWAHFAPLEVATTVPAASLVKFSKIKSGDVVLDVGCGTGVVAITAARMGATVSALDLSPALLEHAKQNVTLANIDVALQEGDVEALPYLDQSFDAVISQFGHMFAPRPTVAIQEMLRVLKPGGTIAFSTWPPQLYVGKMFALVAKFSPPPEGVSPPPLWGDPAFVKQQLGEAVDNIVFDQDVMIVPALSLAHYCHSMELTVGPIVKLLQDTVNNAEKISKFREALKSLVSDYYDQNHIHQHYLMTRARKK